MIGCHPEGVSPKDLKILRYAQNDKHIIRDTTYRLRRNISDSQEDIQAECRLRLGG
jgi:hypothetical protein